MTTVSKIKRGRPVLPDEELFLDATEEDVSNTKKIAEYYPVMNVRMLEWMVQARKRNIRVSSEMVMERARIIAHSIGWRSFRASSGWCVKFLRRNNIRLRDLKRSAVLRAKCLEATGWEDKILNPDGVPVAPLTTAAAAAKKGKRKGAGAGHGGNDSSDSSDSENEEGEDSGFESEPGDSIDGENKPISAESAAKAWNLLQEWFIEHPPANERVMQAVFILNKELTNPAISLASAPAPAPMPHTAGADVTATSQPQPIIHVLASTSSSSSSASSSSSSSSWVKNGKLTGAASAPTAATATAGGAKKQATSATVPITASNSATTNGSSASTSASASTGTSIYQPIPVSIQK